MRNGTGLACPWLACPTLLVGVGGLSAQLSHGTALCCTATECTGVVGAQQGVELVDTLILKHGGRPTGEALVVLPNQVQMEVLLTRNQHVMGRNAVGVAPVTKQVRTALHGSHLPCAYESFTWLDHRMQGLNTSGWNAF